MEVVSSRRASVVVEPREDNKSKLLWEGSERDNPARTTGHTLVRVIEGPSVHVYFSAPRIRCSLVLTSLSGMVDACH
jgi:hypothetical protein